MDLGSRQRWAVCTSETAGFKANSETASCLQISQRSTHQLAPRLPLAADRRRRVRRTAHCPTGTETSFSLTTYLTCASASGSRTVDRPAVRLPCFRHGARLCSRPSSDPQRAEGESAAAAGEVVSAGEICGRGRSAPRRERHPAAVPSRAWRRPPMRQWQIEWLSVAVLSRWLATIERPRASRSRRSPIAWAARRRRSRRTSTTRRARRHGRSRPATRGVPRLRRVHAAAQRQGRRLRVLQGVPPGRDRAPLDARARARRDARVARPLRPAAVVLRLVAHARAPAWRRAARATERRRLALRRAS